MTTWERVRFQSDDDGRWYTVILRNPTEIEFMGSTCVTGVEVDEENDEVVPRGAQVHERRRIVSTDLIAKRTPLKMNNHYAMLEEA